MDFFFYVRLISMSAIVKKKDSVKAETAIFDCYQTVSVVVLFVCLFVLCVCLFSFFFFLRSRSVSRRIYVRGEKVLI